MEIVELDTKSPEVELLIKDIDDLMNSLYPEESNQLLTIKELAEDNVYFIGIKDQGRVVACGAIARKNKGGMYGELKRIYVQPDCRGKGLSKLILNALLDYAREQDLTIVRLETGVKQIEAIGLYERLGFRHRKPFGDYDLDPLSTYMELRVVS